MYTTTANANSWIKIRNVLCLISLHSCLIKKSFIYLESRCVYCTRIKTKLAKILIHRK